MRIFSLVDMITNTKVALTRYGKIIWESDNAWNLIILCLLIAWDMAFIFMVQLSFFFFFCNSIVNL